MRRIFSILFSLFFLVSTVFASKVEVVKSVDGSFQLLKDDEPYYINGAGGTSHLSKLKEYGGNSIRTWGVSDETDQILQDAQQHDLTVCFGIWIGQERQGFDYSNEEALKGQLEMVRQTVRKYKDHPSILIWGIGNEMDLEYSNFDVWKHMEEVCRVVKEEDPNHPTMLVTAGLDVAEIKLINKYTPSLDILGVNTYGNIAYLPKAMNMYGWEKPYIVAEWGPYGWWEVAKTTWGASIEETSSQKAKTYQASMDAILQSKKQCLGSYVFLWGQKQEHTSTWFGLFLESGEESEVMDIMIKGWTNKEPVNKAPSINNFVLNNKTPYDNITFSSGEEVIASVLIQDPDNDQIRYQWQVIPESTDKKTGGDAEKAPKPVKGIFNKKSEEQNIVNFNAPNKNGQYRLFLFAYDGHGNVATGNIPFMVDSK